ncbi:MAG TPA: hypothetical protein VH477_21090 [Bryobacteraceae bacterium]
MAFSAIPIACFRRANDYDSCSGYPQAAWRQTRENPFIWMDWRKWYTSKLARQVTVLGWDAGSMATGYFHKQISVLATTFVQSCPSLSAQIPQTRIRQTNRSRLWKMLPSGSQPFDTYLFP